VATEVAGPESVPCGGGPGNSGSVGPLTVGSTLRGCSGHLDPTMVEFSLVQSGVLSGSFDSYLGLVGVGIPAVAADAADAAPVGDVEECVGNIRDTAERADLPSECTHTTDTKQDLAFNTPHNQRDLTADLTLDSNPDLTIGLRIMCDIWLNFLLKS